MNIAIFNLVGSSLLSGPHCVVPYDILFSLLYYFLLSLWKNNLNLSFVIFLGSLKIFLSTGTVGLKLQLEFKNTTVCFVSNDSLGVTDSYSNRISSVTTHQVLQII